MRTKRKRSANIKKTKVTHSEIINRGSGIVQSITSRGTPTDFLGGYNNLLAEQGYRFSSFHVPADCSSGNFKITKGAITLVVLSGNLYITVTKNVDGEAKTDYHTIRNNDSITFSKGMDVRFGTSHHATEMLMIQGADFDFKTVSSPVVNDTGLAQYINDRNARAVESTDITQIRRRTPKTQAEREAQGRKLAEAGYGTVSGPAVTTSQPSAPSVEIPAVIQGTNPQPMGEQAAALIGE